MVRFHDTGFDMVSLKNPIITKKGDSMKGKNNRQRREQRTWERSQEVLALRKQENETSLRITMEARRRFCRGF